MAVYYSFHYDRDYWRVQQVMNIGAIEGVDSQPLLKSQDWEAVKKKGDKAIEEWIEEKMKYKSAVVVLVGAETSTRRWVKYEITKAWNDKRPLLGIRIHGLKGSDGRTDVAGKNPFEAVKFESGGSLATYIPLFEPTGRDSNAVYASIKSNLKTWTNSGYKRS